MKVISRIVFLMVCLLMISRIGTAQQKNKGFSVKDLNVFLVQIESQLPPNGLIIEVCYYGKMIGVSVATNANERGQTLNFVKINEEWKIKSIGSYYEDSEQKHQNRSMSVKDINAFFIQVEELLPQDEGIVGFEMFGKQIKVKTSSIYIPLAGRGHFITFEHPDNKWKMVAYSEWIS